MRARSIVYWPNIDQDIENKVTHCKICQKYRSSNIKEPYVSHEVLDSPFDKIGLDIFELHKKSYLVLADYFSKYIEILPLRGKTAAEIISKLKLVFATHGIPRVIIADNVPCGSYEFKRFGQAYDIEIKTTSPYYPKANGLAERSVQTAKRIIEKSKEAGEELWLTLLEYRNTPIKNSNTSPAEILMGRKQSTLLPIKKSYFTNGRMKTFKESVIKNQRSNEFYYNKNARPRNKFQANQEIWIKNGKYWERGKVRKAHNTPRSYWVETSDGSILRRNSNVLRACHTNN